MEEISNSCKKRFSELCGFSKKFSAEEEDINLDESYNEDFVTKMMNKQKNQQKYANRMVPKIFDHLKYDLSNEQKHFLYDFINSKVIQDKDWDYASKFTKIPVQNLKSIKNTYAEKEEDKNVWDESRLTFENRKHVNVKDLGIGDIKRDDHINFRKISQEEKEELRKTPGQRHLEGKNNKMYDIDKNEAHDFKKAKRINNEKLDDTLFHYLKGKLNLKNIKIRENGNMELDFQHSKTYDDFIKATLASNKKSEYWIKVGEELYKFNKIFGSHYIVIDQYDLNKSRSNAIRLIISNEDYSNRMIWDKTQMSYIPYEEANEQLKNEFNSEHFEKKPKDSIMLQTGDFDRVELQKQAFGLTKRK